MTRHPHDHRTSSPAVQRARERLASLGIAQVSRTTRDVDKPGGVDIDLNVKVADLEEVGVDIDENLPSAWVTHLLDDGKSPRWTSRDDGHVTVHLERESIFVRVQGELTLKLSHPCVRCLNDVPFDIHMDVDLRLVEKVAGPPEGEWSEGDGDGEDFEGTPTLGAAEDLEDLDIASYQDGVVRVGELMREQLFLELPMHPACDSPRAKPERPCAFDEVAANQGDKVAFTASKWAGLASLRDKLPPAPVSVDKHTPEKKMTKKHELPKSDADKPSSKLDWNKAQSVYAKQDATKDDAVKQDTSLSKTARIPAFATEDDEEAARAADAERDDGAAAGASEAETIISHAIALPGKKTLRAPSAYGVHTANDDDDDDDDDVDEPTVPMQMPKVAKPAAKKNAKAKPAAKKKAKAKAKPAAKKKAKAKAKAKAKPAAKKKAKAKPAAKKKKKK